MAFRADEAALRGQERAQEYLVSKNLQAKDRSRAQDLFFDLLDELGPVVDGYPVWHPIVAQPQRDGWPATRPSELDCYKGLDHTVYFAHGFVTCPYKNGQRVIDCVEALGGQHSAELYAERLDTPMYNTGTDPIVVKCTWDSALELGKTVPKRLAVGLMVESQVPIWRRSQVAETWATMRPYLLGQPHGSRSSLFVSQETAMAMKRVHDALINSGMYGPILV